MEATGQAACPVILAFPSLLEKARDPQSWARASPALPLLDYPQRVHQPACHALTHTHLSWSLTSGVLWLNLRVEEKGSRHTHLHIQTHTNFWSVLGTEVAALPNSHPPP